MLILTRKPGEGFYLGNDIYIAITEIKGNNQVAIAIDAPKNVNIVREELIEEASKYTDSNGNRLQKDGENYGNRKYSTTRVGGRDIIDSRPPILRSRPHAKYNRRYKGD